MLEVVSWFIVCLVTHILDCYVFSKLVNEKFRFNIKNILIIIIITIVDYIVNIKYTYISKLITTNLITFLLLKIVYKKSVAKTLIGTMFTYMAYTIAESTFAIIFFVLLKIDVKFIIENPIGIIISNITIFFLYVVLFKNKKINALMQKITNWYEYKAWLNIILDAIVAMIVVGILLYQVSLNKLPNDYVIIVFTILIGIIVFVIGFFNEKSNNNKLTIEYGQLLEYVKDYEKEVVEKGKRQHEYKNQLIVINDMIPKTNKKLKKYVEDKLEVEKNIKDNVWLEKLTNLPSGGIKGLVYYKLKQMIEKNIDVYVEIDNELSDKKKWFNIEKYLEDYTRILGVYLDNSIEAAIESKDKQIIIEFKENEDNIEFILSNTYVGKINYDSIDKEKFSTKGKGRGYGLSLVKDIIDNNKLLNQSREINGKFYVQKLTIKK